MTARPDRRRFLAGAVAGAIAGGLPLRAMPDGGTAAAPRADIDAERRAIRAGMAKEDITAAAVCLVEDGRATWTEGFGHTGEGRDVTDATRFSIQSTTKHFTAVAVLLAVQDGLLDLDAPLARYLPWFRVQSRFEAAPQDHITLRLLLANRAGFTHEAPVGNNYDAASPSFEAHVRSIADTWLRFPAGDRYRYSNLGFDLAGFIAGQAGGGGYADWLRRRLFDPLGMADSSADPAVFAAARDRATGRQRGYDEVPAVTPLVASGGIWTSARDMARYLAFLLAGGRDPHGRAVLSPDLFAEMHAFSDGGDYALGVMRSERAQGGRPVRMLHHRGGGFGFGCGFAYCPDAGIGWAAMFNRPASAGYRFGDGLVDGLLAARVGPRTPRLPPAALSTIVPSTADANALLGSWIGRNLRVEVTAGAEGLRFRRRGDEVDQPLRMTAPDELFVVDAAGDAVRYRWHRATAGMPAHLACERGEESLDHDDGPGLPDGPDDPAWDRWVGDYLVLQWGRPSMRLRLERRRGWLVLDGTRLVAEHAPGLFFTSDGESVDFRGPVPTWRNLRLQRA